MNLAGGSVDHLVGWIFVLLLQFKATLLCAGLRCSPSGTSLAIIAQTPIEERKLTGVLLPAWSWLPLGEVGVFELEHTSLPQSVDHSNGCVVRCTRSFVITLFPQRTFPLRLSPSHG